MGRWVQWGPSGGGARWKRELGFRGGGERLPVSGAEDQMWSGEPPSGAQTFILEDTALTNAGWGREKVMGQKEQ